MQTPEKTPNAAPQPTSTSTVATFSEKARRQQILHKCRQIVALGAPTNATPTTSSGNGATARQAPSSIVDFYTIDAAYKAAKVAVDFHDERTM
ncbi:FAD/NAD(P)-binding domain-containing protein [Colletotrichum sp. SAR 10_75]|nr:FAD/NAD(P)-binding domain-containing protein [Colletotrichum sp. SAR 10_75]